MNSTNDMYLIIFDGANPPLRVNLSDYGKNYINIGREVDNDIILTSRLVSKYHAQIAIDNNNYYLCDNHSTNGIYIDNQKIAQSALLQSGNTIKIASDDCEGSDVVTMYFGNDNRNMGWFTVNISNTNELWIGRNDDCLIQINNSRVSKHHAKIMYTTDGYYLYDNHSSNGVFLNGEKLDKNAKLSEQDVIQIANCKMVFSSEQISYIIYDSGIEVETKDIVKTVHTSKGNLNIVNHINLKIEPGEFVAIIGGSGAGKSSFLNCISGYSKPTSGQVLINGDDLYDNYETLKQMIGYVPQDDIVYENLTVFGMLDYTAKLRMPNDTTRQERHDKVNEVIKMVELEGREKFLIKSLSGGQRKRVSIAVELLSDPNLFFLDEPSSGLDPGTEENLMIMLSKMAKTGKTIILITHNTMNIHLCDKIVFLGKGGNLCYYGEPDGAYQFFGVEKLVRVYNMVTEHSEEWKNAYNSYYGNQITSAENDAPLTESSVKMARKGSILHQTSVLTGRYFNLMFRDIKRLLLLLLQAPLLGVLLYLVADDSVYKQYEMTKAVLFALACCAFWIGILNSIQEVCKERTILKREYLSGLSMTAYILSKFIVLGFFCLVQSALLLGTVGVLIGLPENGIFLSGWLEMYISVFLTALSATSMGLFVSSLFNNADRAMTVAPILLMPQILFSGLAFQLSGAIEKVSYVVSCRWAMEAFGSIADLNNTTLRIQETIPEMVHEAESFYTHSTWHLMFSWEILLGFTIIFGILSYVALANIEKS